MSGGAWDYAQYRITELYEGLEHMLEKAGKEIPKEDRWSEFSDTHYPDYSGRVKNELAKGAFILRVAQIYAQRADYLQSGDDGEESFLRRLGEDLSRLGLKEEDLEMFSRASTPLYENDF